MLFGFLLFVIVQYSNGFLRSVNQNQFKPFKSFVLFDKSMSEEKNVKLSTGERGKKGYYVRPSKAIEQGGGFYVPGLEDEKIRLVSSGAIILAFFVNRAGQPIDDLQQVITECIGYAMALILFIQGIPDSILQANNREEDMKNSMVGPSAGTISVLNKADNINLNDDKEIIVKQAKGMLQASQGLNYIMMMNPSDNQYSGKQLEMGPLDFNGLNLPASVLLAVITEPESDYKLLKNPPKELPLPSTTDSCIVAKGQNGQVWVIGSKNTEALENDKDWLVQMVKAS